MKAHLQRSNEIVVLAPIIRQESPKEDVSERWGKAHCGTNERVVSRK